MNKCKICGKDSGRGKTCGSTCRSKLARSVASASVATENATVEQSVAGYDTGSVTQGQVVDIVEGQTVYGRQAVRWPVAEAWSLRPEPLSFNDQPKPGSRGKYIRPDGSEYQFDACGKVFECTLVDGESLVYPTIADLRQAQKARREAS